MCRPIPLCIVSKSLFFGPLEPIRGKQCGYLDLIVAELPFWPIQPTLLIRRDANELRQTQPVPWMWAVPAGADICGVRLGDIEG